MSPQQDSKFSMRNNKNAVISAILRKGRQKDAGIFLIKRLET